MKSVSHHTVNSLACRALHSHCSTIYKYQHCISSWYNINNINDILINHTHVLINIQKQNMIISNNVFNNSYPALHRKQSSAWTPCWLHKHTLNTTPPHSIHSLSIQDLSICLSFSVNPFQVLVRPRGDEHLSNWVSGTPSADFIS